jgi:hypothetical protein
MYLLILFIYIRLINDWLIVYCFTSRWRMFHLYGGVTSTSEGLQNLGLCSALRAFEQGLGDLYRATPAMIQGLRFSGLIQRTARFSRLLRHTTGGGGSILTQILTGSYTYEGIHIQVRRQFSDIISHL